MKIPLLQVLKDVPIYAKEVKYFCIKRIGRKKEDPKTIHVVGKVADLMLGKLSIPKYVNLGS